MSLTEIGNRVENLNRETCLLELSLVDQRLIYGGLTNVNISQIANITNNGAENTYLLVTGVITADAAEFLSQLS